MPPWWRARTVRACMHHPGDPIPLPRCSGPTEPADEDKAARPGPMPTPSPPPAPPTFRPNPTALPSRRPCAPAAAASTSTRAGGTSRRPRFLAGGCRGCLFVSAASVAPCAGGCGGRSPAWAGAGSRGRLCGVGKEPKQGASRGRSGLGMRRATHARAASRELRPAAAQRRPRLHESKAPTGGRIGARPGRPGPGKPGRS